jgi:hypothetical protein
MDADRFARELPELFEDFPRSERPRGRRFDDILAAIPSLAKENNLALVNLAASLLADGEAYVEAGTYHGASLIAAMRGNDGGEFVGIDNFSFTSGVAAGRTFPGADRGALEANLARFGASGARIVEGDVQAVLERGELDGTRIGAFYYDAAHDYDSQLGGLRAVEPYLADEALLIVDDSDWEQVGRAVQDYLVGEPLAESLVTIGGSSRGLPQWWEGVVVLLWRR